MRLLPRRLSVVCDRLITNRSRSGDLDLQGPGAARSARACPSHASQKPLRLIKVLSDLVILFLLNSIDIKVFQTFASSSCLSC